MSAPEPPSTSPLSAPPPAPVHGLVVAAGRGTRAGPGGPKQYRALGGMTVLRRTLLDVLDWPGVAPARVRVAIHPDDAAASLGPGPRFLLGDRAEDLR